MRKPVSFRHPILSRHDERIAALIGEHGHAGYGLYWLLIEIIQGEPDMALYYTEHRIRRLSAVLGITSEELKLFVGDLIYGYDLLILEDDHLRSAITYRRPRKPKPTPEPTPSTDTELTPSTQETTEPFSNVHLPATPTSQAAITTLSDSKARLMPGPCMPLFQRREENKKTMTSATRHKRPGGHRQYTAHAAP